jgi:thiosulfate reductase cytochrome b subunit
MALRRFRIILLIPLLTAAGLAIRAAAAGPAQSPNAQGSPVHPAFALLDAQGRPVVSSGAPLSTLATCGQCHDTDYIQAHNSHAQAAANTATAEWDPLIYRYVSTAGQPQADLDAAGWLREFGWRWAEGSQAEPNCLLCHLSAPDNEARLAALEAGQAEWANSATLAQTGLIAALPGGWQWNAAAFDGEGVPLQGSLALQDPASENCGACHGVAHTDTGSTVVTSGCDTADWQTAVSGQVFAAERISTSGTNLADKDSLVRPWDVHAERGLTCTDCHFAPNNPVRAGAAPGGPVEHLLVEPRRLELGEYIQRPSHDFTAPAQCADCHAAAETHGFLPYASQHMEALACETCHVPRAYAPALDQVDWTVLSPSGEPRSVCRGVEGNTGATTDLVTGFAPVALARVSAEAGEALAPFNLVAAWYWEHGGPGREAMPVRLADLQAAYFTTNGGYAPGVLAAFDANGDSELSPAELVLDSDAKTAAIAGRLAGLGLVNPRIAGQVRPYALNHSVAGGEWAVSDCRACHNSDSLLATPMALAEVLPGGALPTLRAGPGVELRGELAVNDGRLEFTPDLAAAGRYVFGHSRANWADWAGAGAFVAALAGVAAHGGLRLYSAWRAPRSAAASRRVYMYSVYERFWHWLQALAIALLLFTGLVIHRPDLFGLFSFRHVVLVHNVLAGLLVLNAALALFYHLASGEIRQYLPRPYGFFDQAAVQVRYYLRGIFRGEPHPFEKTPRRKLNPLQQFTYFGILNVLLPLQVITGALMWGAQQWPQAAVRLGGLPGLAPIHSLIAWLFAAFVVAHVYLTTTGHAPLAGIQAMMDGWDEVDLPLPEEMTSHDNTDQSPATPAEA